MFTLVSVDTALSRGGWGFRTPCSPYSLVSIDVATIALVMNGVTDVARQSFLVQRFAILVVGQQGVAISAAAIDPSLRQLMAEVCALVVATVT